VRVQQGLPLKPQARKDTTSLGAARLPLATQQPPPWAEWRGGARTSTQKHHHAGVRSRFTMGSKAGATRCVRVCKGWGKRFQLFDSQQNAFPADPVPPPSSPPRQTGHAPCVWASGLYRNVHAPGTGENQGWGGGGPHTFLNHGAVQCVVNVGGVQRSLCQQSLDRDATQVLSDVAASQEDHGGKQTHWGKRGTRGDGVR
jgi:hypothetical protein